MNFFRTKKHPRTPPPTVPTDTIIPLSFWDCEHHVSGLSFDITFRFDDVLDHEALRAALARLLQLGNWRKLGARLRRNPATEGGLEYHVPQTFDDKRPGFAYSSATFAMPIDAHPEASRLARPQDFATADRPAVFSTSFAAAPAFRAFIRTPGFPERLDDWLYSDSPQLGIRTIVFADATLVTISFLHSLMDMMGMHAIMEAWTAVLRGEEDKVKPFEGFAHDALAGLGKPTVTAPLQKYVFTDTLLVGWSWILFGLRYLLTTEWLWHRREEERLIFLPGKHLTQMRNQAMAELTAANSKPEPNTPPPFISEGDVIFAWWTRVALRAEKPSPSRTINLRNTYCCRSLLAEMGYIPSATSALVTNAVFATLTFLTVGQVLTKPLSFTANEIRKSLLQQRNVEQLHALIAIQRRVLEEEHHPALFGDPTMRMMMMSNWVKADLFAVDFSAAVVSMGMALEKRANLVGRPSCVQGTGTKAYATRNTGVVIGKDARGDFWLLYTLRKKAWKGVERELSAMGDVVG
ncbi:LysR family regulatory protein [Cercophora scortea]|uniref:LysR family regulatory protein n=1 Tax=Cercophora scortea TaxID=314031 RepID=A0AAE0I2I7_9PEZI|nr:LysR family regulatory protein [Cercophora scortea]